MQNLDCNDTLRKLMRSVIGFPNRQNLLEYLKALSDIPDWESLLWTFPDLRKKYRQSLIALHKELVPNYISAHDIQNKLWEYFKEISVNANQYRTKENLSKKLSEFCNDVKKPLTTYEVIYEINNIDIKKRSFVFGNVEVFKLSVEYLVNRGWIRDELDESRVGFKDLLGKSVIKTDVSVARLSLAYDSGLKIVKDVLDIARLIAVYGKIDVPDDQSFLWEIGQNSMTIPKMVENYVVRVGTDFHRGFGPSPNPMDSAISRGLYALKSWQCLFDGTLPDDIMIRVNNAIKWTSQAVISSSLDFKIVYLCTALEILLLPGHKVGKKGELIALRQVLLGRGNSYTPETILHLYEKRSNIIHNGMLEITSYSAYWNLLICCFDVIRNIIDLSKRNTSISKLIDLLKIVENVETLQDFIHNCELGIYDDKGINEIKKTADTRLKQLQGK